jgi:hypothetical protein
MSNIKSKSNFSKLQKAWTKKHQRLSVDLFKNHKQSFEWLINNSKQITVGSLTGLFLLTQPVIAKVPTAFSQELVVNKSIDKNSFLIYDLKALLPDNVMSLNPQEEKNVSEVLTRDFGVNVYPEILGKRLNTTYGYIGQEQHLARFPGDTMFSHFQDEESAKKYWQYGMAPGLGSWRYFSNTKEQMTQKDIDREKYYIAVQTFLAPGFDNNPKEYVDFFKYRKMLVVNPNNGKAVVAIIGDAGPSPWTGKQLGGSPEVMTYLERYDGAQKGGVLYFFIDDPNDTIPLGPINVL